MRIGASTTTMIGKREGRPQGCPPRQRLAAIPRVRAKNPAESRARVPLMDGQACATRAAIRGPEAFSRPLFDDADERIGIRHGPPVELYLRRTPRLRARRIVRPRQRAIAASAHADVRPHHLHRRGRRRLRQGPCGGRARRAAGPLVLPLPLQGRSGDAGLPRRRRPLADGRLLPRLARLLRVAAGRSASAR